MFGEILAGLFLATSAAQVLTTAAVKYGLNFFQLSPGKIWIMPLELAQSKTFDLLFFVLLIIISGLIYVCNNFYRNGAHKYDYITRIYWITSAIILLQTHFVRSSGTQILISIIVTQVCYMSLRKLGLLLSEIDWLVSANGLLSGFYMTFFVRMFTTSTISILGTIVVFWLVYQLLWSRWPGKWMTSPGHLVLAGGVFVAWNTFLLTCCLILAFTAIALCTIRCPRIIQVNIKSIYIYLAVFLVVYDPLFYFGNLDSIEEGFWLGWLQRLISGQILYRDVAVYHPPLLIWGLGAFTKLFGQTIYMVRLYFHLLEIIGVGIIFTIIRKCVRSRLNVIMTTVLILAFFSNQVRNNVEIRLGSALLALMISELALSKKSGKWLWIAGICSGIAMGISIETGIASLIGSVLMVCVSSRDLKGWLRQISVWLGGVILFMGLIGSSLAVDQALRPAVSQISFYARAFSQGYFNLAVDRGEVQNMLQWWRVNRYVGSVAVMWDLATWGISLGFMYLLYKWKSCTFELRERFLLGLLGFSLILSRVALGRSDWYHLLFMLVGTTIATVTILESWSREINSQKIMLGLWLGLVLVVNRDLVWEKMINMQVFKIQSYANMSQRYLTYENKRAGIYLDVDAPAAEYNELLSYLQSHTKDSDKIFAYPWQPELYFLANRNNSTSFDTPYAFFSEKYQNEIIGQLTQNPPKYIIYNPETSFANMTANSLPKVNSYITAEYKPVKRFKMYQILMR